MNMFREASFTFAKRRLAPVVSFPDGNRAKEKAANMFSSPITPMNGAEPGAASPDMQATVALGLALRPVADPAEDPAEDPAAARGAFGYLSAERPSPAPDPEALSRAAAMIAGAPRGDGFHPDPEAAAFLRFVSHDLALMPRDGLRPDAQPLAREAGARTLVNLRRGAVDLSSLYGPGDMPSPGLRDPSAPARMLIPVAQAPSADPRNHLTPELSRIHRALLNLHNMAVEDCDDPGLAAAGPDALFGYARAEVRLLVQWLTMNRALPALCPPSAMEAVADGRAPLFTRMVARMGGGTPPVPLEAVLAALPLIARSAAAPDDVATLLHLARRVALPSGQETVRAVNRAFGARMTELTGAELCAGPAAPVMTGGMLSATPLWLYLLREAEERGENGRLGPLGGHVAAQSVAGLIVSDPYSYWLRPGETGGRWRPSDGVLRMDGRPIETLSQLIAAAAL